MIELPNNQISRNLPEQVGFNTSKIKEIIDFLNESGMKDLVVNLEADSGVLTNEQFAVLELSPSYIVLNGRVFYKALEDGTNIDFFDLSAPSIAAGVSTQTVKRIRIVEATKNYSTTDVVLSSYTKDELDTALAAKADLAGATFTGDVSANKLEQSFANYEQELTLTYSGVSPNKIELTKYYSYLKIINGMTYVIINCKLTNTGDSAENLGTVSISQFQVPPEIGEKIYNFKNENLNEDHTEQTLICCETTTPSKSINPSGFSDQAGFNVSLYLKSLVTKNYIVGLIVKENRGATIQIPAGETIYISIRSFLVCL